MKNLFKAVLLIMFVALAQSSPAKIVVYRSKAPNGSETLDAAGAQKLINRLEELKAMDKSSLTGTEKRAMRKEVKAIKKTLDSSGGVYLSVGVVILIIVLLIIFI